MHTFIYLSLFYTPLSPEVSSFIPLCHAYYCPLHATRHVLPNQISQLRQTIIRIEWKEQNKINFDKGKEK